MAASVLNSFCQKAGLKPEWTWAFSGARGPIAGMWIGTLRIPGISHEATHPGQNKKVAQELCVTDFIGYLTREGLLDPSAGSGLPRPLAKGPPLQVPPIPLASRPPMQLSTEPLAKKPKVNIEDWPELQELKSDGAAKPSEPKAESVFIPVGLVNATPEQLLEQKQALAQFNASLKLSSKTKAIRTTNVDAKFQEILKLVRQAQPEAAIDVAKSMTDMEGPLPLKHYSTIISSVSCRVDPQTCLKLLMTIEELNVVEFVDEACKPHYSMYSKWIAQDLIADGDASIQRAVYVPSAVLEAGGHCVSNLRAEREKAGTEVELKGNIPYAANFQKGDWVFITCHDIGMQVGSVDGTVEAEVVGVPPVGKGVTVKIIGRTDQEIAMLVDRWVRVDKAGNRVTYARQVDALRQACFLGPEMQWLKTAIFDTKTNLDKFGDPVMEKQAAAQLRQNGQSSALLAQLNDSQQRAVTASVVRRMTVIQGPPGTGKTYTASMLIQLLVLSGHTPILASADSNIAVDNLLGALAQTSVRVVRIGRPESTRPDLEKFNIESQFKGPPGVFTGFAPTKGKEWGELTRFVKMAQVICSTCSGAAQPLIEGIDFKAIVVDEATQATEPSTLIPCMKANPESAIVLVGDHCQLPPTVLSKEACDQGFGISFFERLVSRGMKPLLLDVQYRMHPAIAVFPSLQFYDSMLRSGVPGSLRPAPKALSWRDRRVPISVIPVQGQEFAEGTSFVNSVEAQMVKQLCCHVLSSSDELAAHNIGIISPYAAQVRRIKRELGHGSAAARNVEVNSVDGFQGREKELIIVSTVRANAAGNIGFLSDPRRLNVAITRAKRGLVVLGDLKTLASDQLCWGPWLSWAQEVGLIQGSPPTDRLAAVELANLDGLTAEELKRATTKTAAKFA